MEWAALAGHLPTSRPLYDISWQSINSLAAGQGSSFVGGIRRGRFFSTKTSPLTTQMYLGLRTRSYKLELIHGVPALQGALKRFRKSGGSIDQESGSLFARAVGQQIWQHGLIDDFSETILVPRQDCLVVRYQERPTLNWFWSVGGFAKTTAEIVFVEDSLQSILLRPTTPFFGPDGLYSTEEQAHDAWKQRYLKAPKASSLDFEEISNHLAYIRSHEDWWLDSSAMEFDWWDPNSLHEVVESHDLGTVIQFEVVQGGSEFVESGYLRGLAVAPNDAILFTNIFQSLYLLSAGGVQIQRPKLSLAQVKAAVLGCQSGTLKWNDEWVSQKIKDGSEVIRIACSGELDLGDWGYPQEIIIHQTEFGFQQLTFRY